MAGRNASSAHQVASSARFCSSSPAAVPIVDVSQWSPASHLHRHAPDAAQSCPKKTAQVKVQPFTSLPRHEATTLLLISASCCGPLAPLAVESTSLICSSSMRLRNVGGWQKHLLPILSCLGYHQCPVPSLFWETWSRVFFLSQRGSLTGRRFWFRRGPSLR